MYLSISIDQTAQEGHVAVADHGFRQLACAPIGAHCIRDFANDIANVLHLANVARLDLAFLELPTDPVERPRFWQAMAAAIVADCTGAQLRAVSPSECRNVLAAHGRTALRRFQDTRSTAQSMITAIQASARLGLMLGRPVNRAQPPHGIPPTGMEHRGVNGIFDWIAHQDEAPPEVDYPIWDATEALRTVSARKQMYPN